MSDSLERLRQEATAYYGAMEHRGIKPMTMGFLALAGQTKRVADALERLVELVELLEGAEELVGQLGSDKL